MRTLVLVLPLLALAATTAPAGPAATSPKLVAKLDRQGCYGRCPMYKIAVFDDGTVLWKGVGFVKVPGRRSTTVDVTAIDALKQAFADAKFFDLPKDIGCEKTDQPVARITFVDGDRRRTVTHESCGTTGTTAALANHRVAAKAVEAAIDALAGSDQWIGTEAERAQARRTIIVD